VTAPTGSDALIGELRGLLSRLDPVPPRLLDEVRRAFCWRTVDAELAELSFDSLVDQEALAVRTGDTALEPRMLGFGAVVDGEDLAIEVEVTATPGGTCLMGQLWPAVAGTVDVQTVGGGSTAVDVDELGRFLVDPVPAGPVRLSVRFGTRLVQTTWVSYTSG
jgi:hypothetical protein